MSIRHAEIVKLMEEHMGEVKKLARAKTKKAKAKATQIAVAA
jgi:hypothetical protein